MFEKTSQFLCPISMISEVEVEELLYTIGFSVVSRTQGGVPVPGREVSSPADCDLTAVFLSGQYQLGKGGEGRVGGGGGYMCRKEGKGDSTEARHSYVYSGLYMYILRFPIRLEKCLTK